MWTHQAYSHLTVCTLQEDGEALCAPALTTPATWQAMEQFELLLHLGHPDMAVRHLAGRAILAQCDDAEALLMAQLEHPAWTIRQEEALSLLVGLQSRGVVPLLLDMLPSPEEPRRLAAIKALRWLADEAWPFLQALRDPAWRVRLEAVFALSDMGRPEDRPALEMLLKDAEPRVRQAASAALDRWRRYGPERSLGNVLRRRAARGRG